jgi:hypothetical protein
MQIMSIGTQGFIVLFDFETLFQPTPMNWPKNIDKIMSDGNIIKCGTDGAGDLACLGERHVKGIQDLGKYLHRFESLDIQVTWGN